MKRVSALLTVSALFALVSGIVLAAPALAASIKISTDPFTNSTSQHQTEVEPDTFAFGPTIVATVQVGRFFDGGSSDIGFATSTNAGTTWTPGFLPGTTPFASPPGTYARVSDPSVAFDPKHGAWIISMLGLFPPGHPGEVDVLASRSTDGGLTWSNPIVVNASGRFNDKNWTACDTTAASPFYGNCYTEWDDNSFGNLEQMSTSSDGGLTWGPAKSTANSESGIGGQPVVLGSGRVVVPFLGNFGIEAFNSMDGGNSWSTPVRIANVNYHGPAGGIRAPLPGPTAEVLAPHGSQVFVAWSDCRFEPSCSANDIVLSSSGDGVTWGPVQRIPIDPIGSGVDHFIPGIAVQPKTSFSTPLAHLALGYYYYPVSNCNSSTCQLNVGYVFSTNGGSTWSAPQQLAGPMQLSWLANTNQGRMVGDYMSTSYGLAQAFPVYASAVAPTGGTICGQGSAVCHEDLFTTPETGLSMGPGLPASSAGAHAFAPWHPKAGLTAN
jgi:hypothetical protein